MHPVEPGTVDVDIHPEFIAVVIARRVVADLLAVGQLAFFLGLALLHVHVAAGDLGEIQHVGIGLLPAPGRGHHEFSGILVQQHPGIHAKGACNVEFFHLRPVCLAVFQLGADLLHRALAALRKPGRELLGTLLAQVAVL